jgi:hypothetical protein
LVCRARAVGGWGALRGRRENREGAPGDVQRGRSVLAMMILEGMNCLDVSWKSATIHSDILPELPCGCKVRYALNLAQAGT